jgi:GMP synthase-like glutamine amidotransferase
MVDDSAPNETIGNPPTATGEQRPTQLTTGRRSALRVIVIRHHAEDSAGFIGMAFQARGAELSTHLFPDHDRLPPLGGADHIVVLGASPSVYDDGPASGWIAQELAWLRLADGAGVPVLGICFGAQALCAALGGQVVPAGRREVGWTMIDSLDPMLIPSGPWLQFHRDRCLPSARARILASNKVGVQAFSIGPHLAVQFHPEVDGAQLGLWMANGGREETEQAGQDPDSFLAQTLAEELSARTRADLLVGTALRLAESAVSNHPPSPPPTG